MTRWLKDQSKGTDGFRLQELWNCTKASHNKIWNSKDENCPSDEQLKDVDARLNIKRRSLNPKKNDNKPTVLMYFDGTTKFWRFNRKVDGVDRAPKNFLNDEDVYLKCEDLSKSKSKKVTWLLNDMGQPEVKVNEFEIEEGSNMEETPFQTPNKKQAPIMVTRPCQLMYIYNYSS